ncbi:MAG: endonuclease III [Chloroflexota bacterium]|nr:endonuclease III [Chloroflexota bacterium]
MGRRPLDRADPAERTRARAIVARLAKAYPDWGPTLDFTTPLELLIATLLAAQARDERVNEVTKPLFRKYRSARDWLRVPDAVLERELKPTGFFRQKTKAVKGACQGIVERFGGEVPKTMDELVSLHGVGQKTASIVLGGAFAVPSIAVDRHVVRVAGRLRLTSSDDPEAIAEDLRTLLPRPQWVKATWTLVLHGRRTCRPIPECPACPVAELCPYPKKTVSAALPSGEAARRRAPTAPPRRGARRPAGG